MKLTFAQIANSSAYQVEASKTSKANCFVATVTAVAIMIFASWGFGFGWVIIIPCLWFAASLLVAMPFMFMRTAIAAAYSEHPSRVRAIGGFIDIANYVLLIAAVYYGLRALHDWIAA
jgi:ABC-type siderophore export system fused ATPase/permease subunit